MSRQDETTPVHELGIGFSGLVITAVVGSFLVYHLYLISYVTIPSLLLSSNPFRSVNRTTLEDLSPFLLLRLIPNLTNPHEPFPTPEHRLSYNQRRVVKRAHRKIQLYNVGWRKNWGQVFGWERRRGWIHRILLGGAGYVLSLRSHLDGGARLTFSSPRMGDGRSFPRNPRSEEMLAKLADDLHNTDKDL